jgi:hypothetical protein
MAEKWNTNRVLVGKSEGKTPPRRFRRRLGNIKLDLREIEWSMGWIHLAQGRDQWLALVDKELNPRFP